MPCPQAIIMSNACMILICSQKSSATNYIMESVNRQLRAIGLEYTFIREKKKVKEFF